MARILITSGPTRQYLDPVRYLTNASSGKMGAALAEAAIARGHDIHVVSGPVHVSYPTSAKVTAIETTAELLEACQTHFPDCDGLIGAAAPCDYKPTKVSPEKLKKTGGPMLLELVETEDVVAAMGRTKSAAQWLVGFALETNDARFRALTKLQKKCCDLVVLNGPSAIESSETSIEILNALGEVISSSHGSKLDVATKIIATIDEQIINKSQ